MTRNHDTFDRTWLGNRWERSTPVVIPARARPVRIGIGGPVGTGKTALVWRLCEALRDRISLAVITNDIYTKEDAEFLLRHAALPPDRILGVETGGCPHSAIRDDPSLNLDAVDDLQARHPDLALILIESGGDNLTAIFSPELADASIFVIDVSGGDKIPRKGGPGVSRSDLLLVNKIDLAPMVGASLDVMDRDAKVQRGERPTLFTNLRDEAGVEEVIAWVDAQLERYRQAWANVPGVEVLGPPRSLIAGDVSPVNGMRDGVGDRASVSPTTYVAIDAAPAPATRKLPRYDYECKACDTRFDVERPMSEASAPYPCPFCGGSTRRIFSAPKLMFKADPRDNRPIWHNHGAYGHQHAPGRGRHRNAGEDH